VVECVCFGINCAEATRPEDPDYPFWQWLAAHPDLFPEVNDHNMASARSAFAQHLAQQKQDEG
jgi:hypothetical protein